MSEFKQADRLPGDGTVEVSVYGTDFLILAASTEGEAQAIRVSKFNAARLFAMMAMFLGINLPSKLGKSIKF